MPISLKFVIPPVPTKYFNSAFQHKNVSILGSSENTNTNPVFETFQIKREENRTVRRILLLMTKLWEKFGSWLVILFEISFSIGKLRNCPLKTSAVRSGCPGWTRRVFQMRTSEVYWVYYVMQINMNF